MKKSTRKKLKPQEMTFLRSLAADEATPCERLSELAKSSQLVIARIVATNAAISPDVVEALQSRKDSKINRALAANPGTPIPILQQLGIRYTSEFVHNPIFKMEHISDPFFLINLPTKLKKKILTNESTPESILFWVCDHMRHFDLADKDTVEQRLISSPHSLQVVYNERFSTDDRHRFAQWEQLPQEIVCALAADKHANVRLAVARRHDLSETVVRQLSEDPEVPIRHHIARRVYLSQEIVCTLAADRDQHVRLAVAERHDLSEPVVLKLSKDPVQAIRNVFLTPDLARARVSAWADVLEEKPDELVVRKPDFRGRIIATGLPWRVLHKETRIEMLLIPLGIFQMGLSPNVLMDLYPPNAHEVFISRAFYLGRTPVTQEQWQAAKVESNPSRFTVGSDRPSHPVDNVSWKMVESFNTKTDLRLPTEAEWEYACRAGSTTSLYGKLNNIAWHQKNSGGKTHEVRKKLPNDLGLFDMLGNVWEWCQDRGDGIDDPGIAIKVDPTGPETGDRRVLRGGSFDTDPIKFSASLKRPQLLEGRPNNLNGFRVARNP